MGEPNQQHTEPAFPERKRCKVCGKEKPTTRPDWPQLAGKPVGHVCTVCAKIRRKRYYRQDKEKVKAVKLADVAKSDLTPEPPLRKGTDVPAKVKATRALPVAKNDKAAMAQALKAGAGYVNEHAHQILDILFDYATDTGSPHHEWAFKLVADRILPKRLYDNFGDDIAGVKGGGSVRPEVNIIVQPATLPQQADPSPRARVITIERSEYGKEEGNTEEAD